jgi:hypothetical protein
MEYTALEADIHDGQITVRQPDKLPAEGRGLLIVLPPGATATQVVQSPRRVTLPIVRGDGSRTINPTPEELDDSLWN